MAIAEAGTPVYQYAEHSAHDMKCGKELVWMSRKGPKTKDTELWAVSLPARPEQALSPRRLFALEDGGTIFHLQTAGEWAVFTDFKQHGYDPWADWWKLIAVNLATARTVTLASANAEPMTKQPPRASISGETVVWDEPRADGGAVIRLYDLRAGTARTLALPASVHPTQPYLSGNRVVFLDASTDPSRGSGIWFFLGGTVSTYDLATSAFGHLASSPAYAHLMTVQGEHYTWISHVKDPRYPTGSTSQVELGHLDGRPSEVVGYGDGEVSGEYVVRNDLVANALVVTSLASGKTLLTLAGYAKFNTVCGDRLYFAVMRNDIEGAVRVIKLYAAT